jgi:hypothetical protein
LLRTFEIGIIPKRQGLVAELVGKNIDYVRSHGLPAATGNGQSAKQREQRIDFLSHIAKLKTMFPNSNDSPDQLQMNLLAEKLIIPKFAGWKPNNL